MRAAQLADMGLPESARLTQAQEAALSLIHTYQDLAADGKHLLDGVFGASSPEAWEHYPTDDARDFESGYQWFYHSHSADDRSGVAEHGHIHVFARAEAWRRKLDARREKAWRKALGIAQSRSKTRHLFCIGLSAKGIPETLFTVNSWVTGDAMLSGDLSFELVSAIKLDTGYRHPDALIASLAGLCQDQIHALFRKRDKALAARAAEGPGLLEDTALEVLSEVALDLDSILAQHFS